MEIACHPSYPRNSDIESPPGTFAAYLSCAEIAILPETPSQTVIPIISMRLPFIAAPLISSIASLSRSLWSGSSNTRHDSRRYEPRRLDERIGRYLRIGRRHGDGFVRGGGSVGRRRDALGFPRDG